MTIYGYRVEKFVKAAGAGLVSTLINVLGGVSTPVIKPENKPEPTPTSKLITARIVFGPYNKQFNSNPWIATISAWPQGGKAEYTFINDAWKGDANSGGCIEADFLPGTIIRVGQRNYKNRGASRSEWRLVRNDGSTRVVESSQLARTLWLQSIRLQSITSGK